MEAGMLSEVKHMNTKIEGEAIGLKFVDTDLKEQAVVVDQNLVYATNLTFQPSKDKLIAFHGVTSAIADKMLEKMPPGGWQDKRAFLDDPNIAKFEIDWNPDNIKPERVV